LSKNGFNLVLDEKTRDNVNTAKGLAERVLKDTDWTVSDKCEAFVETAEEALVYLKTTTDIKVHLIEDQQSYRMTSGVDPNPEKEDTIKEDSIVLAFYSCCKDKPYRF
jgi:hypothetical protein